MVVLTKPPNPILLIKAPILECMCGVGVKS